MKNNNLYNKLINNISNSIYRSIKENYFKLNNILKNKNILDNIDFNEILFQDNLEKAFNMIINNAYIADKKLKNNDINVIEHNIDIHTDDMSYFNYFNENDIDDCINYIYEIINDYSNYNNIIYCCIEWHSDNDDFNYYAKNTNTEFIINIDNKKIEMVYNKQIINENYFKISNILKNNSIIDNSNEIENERKKYICNKLLHGNKVTDNELKLIYNYYIVKDKELLLEIIYNTIKFYGNNCDLNWINTSNIIDMSMLFNDERLLNFDGDISLWDVSNVKFFYAMFLESDFNGDISLWNTSSAISMASMFLESYFNGDISQWDVSKVQYFQEMFYSSGFNGDISQWNVSSAIDMEKMFYYSNFNLNIKNWNIDIDICYINKIFKFCNIKNEYIPLCLNGLLDIR